MHRPRSSSAFRTFVRRALLYLLLGAILQYLVAAGFGLSERLPADSHEWKVKLVDGEHFAFVYVEAWRGFGREVWTAYLLTASELEWAHEADFIDAQWTQLRPDVARVPPAAKPRVPPWSRYPDVSGSWRPSDLPTGWSVDGFGVGCGWPWRSASFFGINSPQSGMAVDGGLVIEQAPFIPDDSFPRVVPLRIVWRGAIANTLLYAAVLFVPFTVMPLMRRCLRHRAGRCINCGYDLRGADHEVCPECGTPNSFEPGYLRVMFTVEDIDDTLAPLEKRSAEIIDKVVQYEDT